jgi:hypothetical protein
MELVMNIPAGLFPQPLVNHLGAHSRLDALLSLPEISSAKGIELRRFDGAEPYHVKLDAHGLTLTLQCINPGDAQDQQKWGLHGLTLSAHLARGGWLEGKQPALLKADDVLTLFNVAPNDEQLLNAHPMLCFALEGAGNQPCSVVVRFDDRGKGLKTLSLVRMGEWREASFVEATESKPATETKQPAEAAKRTVICRSGESVPEAGVWEARLPSDHPQAKVFSEAPHRFVFKRNGDAMGTLGLPPFDEAMVVWTWLRSR